ncbi:MAG: hypothetical protein ABSF26_24230 [Thermoguttaceae bacterium]|jgi:hypothetical protein
MAKAATKKPVDRTPICDPAYLRRIDPIWVHNRVPKGFWSDPHHRRDFLLWIGKKLRFRYMRDWYKLSFPRRGRFPYGPRYFWRGSPIEAVAECFPEYDWKEWLFVHAPNRFWLSRANCSTYMDWLADRLGYRQPDDWYRVTQDDFLRNAGNGLVKKYGSSPSAAVMDLIPSGEWHEWEFKQVPKRFWAAPENRQRYFRWLGRELGFRRPGDWRRISCGDVKSHCGTTLLLMFSLHDLMREFLPEFDWHHLHKCRRISKGDILAWADAYHAQHGKWPRVKSGTIAGTDYSWSIIDKSLSQGQHGLPGGSSLAQFLKRHRGASPWLGRPLSEEQILSWADANFAAFGHWPTERTTYHPAAPHESWRNIDILLRCGYRGLPGGSSLPRLLKKYGRKKRPMLAKRIEAGKS